MYKYIYLFLLIVFLSTCTRPLSKEEGATYLRAFDNELIQLGRQIGETHAYKSMMTLVGIGNSPLPSLFRSKTPTKEQLQQYNFDEHKGVYNYHEASGTFRKVSAGDSIILLFPYQYSHDSSAMFVLAEYHDEQSAFQMSMATLLNAKMIIDGITVLSIYYKGEINNGFPVKGKLNAAFGKFILDATMKTQLHRDYGAMEAQLTLSTSSRNIITWEINAGISKTTSNGLTFSSFDATCEIFPVRIKVAVDNDKIRGDSKKFIQDFNQNSTIQAFSMERNQFIGYIQLRDRGNSDKLNFVVIYEDDTFEFLEDFMLSGERILNIKKPELFIF